MDARENKNSWTKKELALLGKLYPNKTCAVVAEKIGRSMRSCYEMAHKQGIKKSAEFLASGKAGRLDGVRGFKTRFKPGSVAWNKGMKGLDIGGKETRFKKGQRPHTWKPIGAERITKDGYLQRKVTDTGYPPKDWVGVHILMWEAAHGKVPAGHAVVFKDKNKKNIVIENLELVSRRELMRRNTVHNLPAELVQVIRLVGAIKRKINRKEREHGKHNS